MDDQTNVGMAREGRGPMTSTEFQENVDREQFKETAVYSRLLIAGADIDHVPAEAADDHGAQSSQATKEDNRGDTAGENDLLPYVLLTESPSALLDATKTPVVAQSNKWTAKISSSGTSTGEEQTPSKNVLW